MRRSPAWQRTWIVAGASVVVLLGCVENAAAADWPMWRYDAGRTASSPHALPSELALRWTRQFSPRVPTWDDPLNNDLMQFDRVLEPIVLGDRVLAGFNDSDKVVCWDLATGEEAWRFYADGPFRLPLAGDGDRVFAASDDGYLYCLAVADGRVLWQIRGGPDDRKVLGNRRVISMWPARGGPVVRDGQVYFAASIWPFMGTFVYAANAADGTVTWVNDRTSASYIKQPHSAPAFAGVAPQGALVATADKLLVPGGRSIPAVFDRRTGELAHFELNAAGKGNGGSFVMSDDEHFYVHTRLRGVRRFDLETGVKTALTVNEPVMCGSLLVTSDEESVKAIRSNANGTEQSVAWELPVDGSADLILAGRRLYAAGREAITVIELSDDGADAQVATRLDVAGAARLAAGGGALVAVTGEGALHVFGAPVDPGVNAPPASPAALDVGEARVAAPNDRVRQTAAWLARHAATSGYALLFGVEDGQIIDELLAATELRLVVVSQQRELVERLRRRYDELGEYGGRVSVHLGTPQEFQAPSYIAHLVVWASASQSADARTLATMYRSVRPYGGLLWLPHESDGAHTRSVMTDASTDWSQAQLLSERGVCVQRAGPLPGAAPWTHLYGDVANTVKSDDALVKAPLGLLWFGGNSHDDVLPRHSHAPSEQVLGGRLFVEGVNSLTARDVYTGRVLWRREFADLGTAGVYYDETYHDSPLSTQYNQVHIPGANARGANFVATPEGVYLVIADRCEVLDAASGATVQTLKLPQEVNPTGSAVWTYIGVYGDVLIAGVDFAHADDASELLASVEKLRERGGAWSPQWFASRRLAVMRRTTGELLWTADARYSFLHNGIVAGDDRIFVLDKLPQSIESLRMRRGQPAPDDYRIAAFAAETGALHWEEKDHVFGTWLGFSEKHDTLMHAGAAASDRAFDEVGAGLHAIDGSSGETRWLKRGVQYSGPCILHGDKVITNSRSYADTSGVFSIRDGEPIRIANPLTGTPSDWTYRRAYGCNTAVASEHLLTFRSGAAGYYDLDSKCGVSNLGGFRSGCTSNLIAADGVLNAPDFTRTCSCGYQNQTSLALIHMPDVEMWTVNPFAKATENPQVQRLGVNFGAAGARRAADGVAWIEYPAATEAEFPLSLVVEGDDVQYVRRHASTQRGDLPWVRASYVAGFSSIVLAVGEREQTDVRYTIRLHFTEQPAEGWLLVQGVAPRFAKSDQQGSGDSPNSAAVLQVYEDVTPDRGMIRIDVQREDAVATGKLAGLEIIAQ